MTYATISGIELRSPEGEFVNEPFVNFSDAENARAMRAALAKVGTQLGREYDLVIGGHRERTSGKITSLNPSRPAQVVGVHQKAGAEHAQEAMDAALRAFHSWSRVPVEVRASLLLNAAAAIRERKLEFSACSSPMRSRKNGGPVKPTRAHLRRRSTFWSFMPARLCGMAQATTPIQYPGERNRLMYIPLGVGAVIPPWNFPFAIMAGMTAAAIVTGNTVILKPSSDSPTIAAMFMEVLEECGLPAGAWQFLPWVGADFLAAGLWPIPQTRRRGFLTGSKPVGLEKPAELASEDPAGADLWPGLLPQARNGR